MGAVKSAQVIVSNVRKPPVWLWPSSSLKKLSHAIIRADRNTAEKAHGSCCLKPHQRSKNCLILIGLIPPWKLQGMAVIRRRRNTARLPVLYFKVESADVRGLVTNRPARNPRPRNYKMLCGFGCQWTSTAAIVRYRFQWLLVRKPKKNGCNILLIWIWIFYCNWFYFKTFNKCNWLNWITIINLLNVIDLISLHWFT